MLPAWRLATNAVFRRPSRAVLLTAIVALSALLISAVGVALGSVRAAIQGRVEAFIGKADARIRPAGGGDWIDASLSGTVRAWPEVAVSSDRAQSTLALRFVRPIWVEEAPGGFVRRTRDFRATAPVDGIDPLNESLIRTLKLAEGRLPAARDEIVIDEALAKRLSRETTGQQLGVAGLTLLTTRAGTTPMKADNGPERVQTRDEADKLNESGGVAVGDTVQVVRVLRDPVPLKVVGIAQQPPLGGTPWSYMTVEGVAWISGKQDRLSRIEVVLKDGVDPEAFVARRAAELPPTVLLQTTEKSTSNLNRNLRANQLGFFAATMMAFIAAAFIIATGMATGVTERQRELAILRCIGAERRQLVLSQLLQGLIIGAAGAIIGVPIGVACAAFMVERYRDVLQAGVTIEWWRIAYSFAGACGCGVLAAAWPAWLVSRVSPLSALAVRAKPVNPRTMRLLTVFGFAGVLLHLGLFTLISEGDVVFWGYVTVGLPGLMLGYFLLGTPALLLVVRFAGPGLRRLLALPPGLLENTIRATPYRFGFTAGALMAGLALMVAIWTQGGAAMRDWISNIRFPDAFVTGLAIQPEARQKLDALPFVTRTSPVGMYGVEIEDFGIKRVTRLKTFFVGFEPRSFFEMSGLTWVQGDPETAATAIERGGAVIVSREFLAAKGKGVGGTFTCWDGETEHSFDIVGVVASPGLEMIGDMYDVGAGFADQRIHAVFGGMKDLKEKFNSEAIRMIQLDLAPDADEAESLARIREELFPYGVLMAGSGREIKNELLRFVNTALYVSSMVAVFAMTVCCFGVANLIIAGVQARRFEFGVLRAVGAQPGLLTRLVLGEAALIALTACLLGTLMGVQGAFGGTRLNHLLWGIEVVAKPPPGPIAVGWGAIFALSILAAAPAIISLGRARPRELLGAVRG